MPEDSHYFKFVVNSNDPGKVTCFECGQMMQDTHYYKLHLLQRHRMKTWKLFVCPFCPSKFADQINGVIHQLKEHTMLID